MTGEGGVLVELPDEDQLLLDAHTDAGWEVAKRRYEQRLIQLAAGVAAGVMVYGHRYGEGAIEEAQSDWAVFFSLIKRWKGERPLLSPLIFDANAPFSAATESAKAILQSDLLPLFEPLFSYLEHQRYLSEEEVYAFLAQHGLHSPAPDGLL